MILHCFDIIKKANKKAIKTLRLTSLQYTKHKHTNNPLI